MTEGLEQIVCDETSEKIDRKHPIKIINYKDGKPMSIKLVHPNHMPFTQFNSAGICMRTKTCVRCGVVIVTSFKRTIRCLRCQGLRNNERGAEFKARQKHKRVEAKKQSPPKRREPYTKKSPRLPVKK